MKDPVKIIALKSVMYKHTQYLIKKDHVYELVTQFETNDMFSGICYVLKCEDGEYHGLDSDYFKIELEKLREDFNI